MSKKKTQPEPVKKSQLIEVPEPKDKTRDKILSELAIGGLCTNAGLVTSFGGDTLGELSLMDCIATLKEKAAKVNAGDLNGLESLLTAQAHALDSIFCSMAARAKINIGSYPDAVNKYMGLALRAQSQCRSTVEAIAEIKNPRPYIQNNKAEYQQVNNGVQARPQNEFSESTTRTGQNPKQTNGLLEDRTDEWMDTGAQGATSRTDNDLEALEKQHGAKDG